MHAHSKRRGRAQRTVWRMDAAYVKALGDQYGPLGDAVEGWWATLDEAELQHITITGLEVVLAAICEPDSNWTLSRPIDREAWANLARSYGLPQPRRLIHWLWYAHP